MLEPGKDFDIDDGMGIIRCTPKTEAASSAFKVLQLRLARLLPQMPNAPEVEIEINGVIGPTVTLAAQAIAMRLAEGTHRDLLPYATAQPEAAIPATAAGALELSGYFDSVLESDPHALVAPMPPQEPQLDPIAMVKNYFTKKRSIAIGSTLAGLAGLGIVASASQARALGKVDRSHFLPASDGSDDFDEDEDDDEEIEDEQNREEHGEMTL